MLFHSIIVMYEVTEEEQHASPFRDCGQYCRNKSGFLSTLSAHSEVM